MTGRLVLASTSRARFALMTEARLTFETVAPGVCEADLKSALELGNAGPEDVAAHLADAKAIEVSTRRRGALVIGADQTLNLEDRLMDKPSGLAEARDQLQRLRGRRHRLHSAVALASDGVVVWRAVATATLHMRAFSDAFLTRYLDAEADQIVHCVGAYRLEGMGVQLFERIEGDYFAILGLPMLDLLQALRTRGQILS